MTPSLVGVSTLQEAHLHQARLQTQVDLLSTAIGALDAVVESLPESGMATVWLLDAVELAERVRKGLR
jgi:hypothetical protein